MGQDTKQLMQEYFEENPGVNFTAAKKYMAVEHFNIQEIFAHLHKKGKLGN